MPKVHILNVSPGDCTLIEHASGRVTGIDICNGNLETRQQAAAMEARAITLINEKYGGGNYGMCTRPSNPINYIKTFDIGKLFRLIVSHPDMDHMDGLLKLHEEVGFHNFWHAGARREKPSFDGWRRYKEEDWDLFDRLQREAVDGVTVLKKIAGDRFSFANEQKDNKSPDALYILAPNKELLYDPDHQDDVNESSYVIQYHTVAGPMIFPGDAHDQSWDFVMKSNPSLSSNCAFLLAPHHGRHSDRDYSFLDFLAPKLTVLGCSPSKFIDYGQWSRRNLPIITSNQAGNIVLDIQSGGYSVYIENETFCRDRGGSPHIRNQQNYYYLCDIETD